MDMLHTKHPNARPPSASSLDTYTGRPLELVPLDITDDTVIEVSGRLSRGAGPGGGRISEPTKLDPEIRGGEQVAATDSCRLC